MDVRRCRVFVTMILSCLGTCALVSAQGTKTSGQTKPQSGTKDAKATTDSKGKSPGIVGTNKSCEKCHGKLKPEPRKPGDDHYLRLDEFTTWSTKDKHRSAYRVLRDERSKTIAKNLAKLDPPGAPTKPAHEDVRCLGCHSVPGIPADAYASIGPFLSAGVGCESCHGAGEKWLVQHKEKPWRSKSAAEKAALGMNDTKDLAVRAKVCAGCHVGTPADEIKGIPARDAFHDIMAAGHPPLGGDYNPAAKFEFSNFHGTLVDRGARHWNEKDKAADFDTRVWLTGQVVAAQTALELLAGRAKAAAADKAPWPEFAEYECSACHHDLDEPSWQQKRGYKSRRPGSLPWGNWYFTMIKGLPGMQQGGGKAVVEQFDAIEKLMSEPYPNPEKVAAAAGQAAAALGKWWAGDGMNIKPQALVGSIKDWVKAGQVNERLDRDTATQLYLALVAINETAGNPAVRAALTTAFEKLSTPLRDYKPDEFGEELKKLQQQLGQ